jgi:hypothetical protein
LRDAHYERQLARCEATHARLCAGHQLIRDQIARSEDQIIISHEILDAFLQPAAKALDRRTGLTKGWLAAEPTRLVAGAPSRRKTLRLIQGGKTKEKTAG